MCAGTVEHSISTNKYKQISTNGGHMNIPLSDRKSQLN